MGLPFPSGVAILGFDVLRAFTKKLWRNSDANMGRDMIYLLEEETSCDSEPYLGGRGEGQSLAEVRVSKHTF